jgi:hypothetical protein
MPSTFSTLYGYITDAIGQADTLGVNLAKRGVNFGQLLAALLFRPPELHAVGSLAVSGSSASLSGLSTRLHDIKAVYNSTGACNVWLIPYDKWKVIVPSGETYIKFYTRFGNTLYVNQPSASNTLSISYFNVPTSLSNDATQIDFDNYDSFITAIGTRFAFACIEEGESSELFQKVGDAFSIPLAMGTKIRNEIEEALRSGYHI